ncbi:glycoside hydrolase family 114 protein [Gonapodya prolifera JEL478]|uniref:alpha-galactosidase n=1 Tax=Gonapodya prolifera (strain JEL478) TaxID=1344416 RepID=A0A138ZX51_GONPJ|nr:glycoside hydrolase family 114 protein [Gonapodya prolifera JEL478]|eukprot:KXS09078.1 glycoside hydrolase family 114 protein [Gonapodya prolifera JEL478]
MQSPTKLPTIPPGTSFQWQLKGTIDTSYPARVYDIDLFDAPAATIAALKTAGHVVICYFSAGTYENWRTDRTLFPTSVRGNTLDEFPDEQWLDVRQTTILQPIMLSRITLAKNKSCDGVEFDNVDGYTNDSGFTITVNDQLKYNQWLADTAHSLSLLTILKNCLSLAEQLVAWYDVLLLEQCVQYKECDSAAPFIKAGKAVFDVEYVDKKAAFAATCDTAAKTGVDAQVKNLTLDAPRMMCRSDYTDQISTPVGNGTGGGDTGGTSGTGTGGTGKGGWGTRRYGAVDGVFSVGLAVLGAVFVVRFGAEVWR